MRMCYWITVVCSSDLNDQVTAMVTLQQGPCRRGGLVPEAEEEIRPHDVTDGDIAILLLFRCILRHDVFGYQDSDDLSAIRNRQHRPRLILESRNGLLDRMVGVDDLRSLAHQLADRSFR